MPKRPRRRKSSSPHSGQVSPVGSPAFSLPISFFARVRSFWNGT